MIGGTRIDYWRNTLRERAFIGGAAKAGPVNSFGMVQLWNPTDSGFILICNKITHVSDALVTNAHTLRFHNAALSGAESQGNKYLNGAAGVGLVKSGDSVMVGTLMFEFRAPPGVERRLLDHSDPIIIPEGLGLILTINSDTAINSTIFEWIEVPV